MFHDLQTLSPAEWESAFTCVLFPMLSNLLSVKARPGERNAMEETRTRAATLLGKVFLQVLRSSYIHSVSFLRVSANFLN